MHLEEKHPLMEPAATVNDLKKYYSEIKAVDGVSFAVDRGEVFGLLGPNGAGKTTTVEILEGLRDPDEGSAFVLGLDVRTNKRKIQERIGVQLQTTALYPRLTVREVIDLFRTFFPGETRPTDELIDLVDLDSKENARSKDLSGGQRQRLSVALALVNKPEIVFLDEPTTGLDPQARRNIWDVVGNIQASGATVFLTTHYMEEAQTLCDRVAVMDKGRIIALDSPDDLIAQNFSETAIEFETLAELPDTGTFSQLPGVVRSRRDDNLITLFSNEPTATLGGLTRLAENGRVHFEDLHVRRATLEDVFLKLTGRKIRD